MSVEASTAEKEPAPQPGIAVASELRNPTMMAERPGLLLRLLGLIFFRRVRFDDDQVSRLAELGRDRTTVYVLASQSLLDYLYLNWVFLRRGLPLAWYGKGMHMWAFRTLRGALARLWRRIAQRKRRPPEQELVRLAAVQGRSVVLFLRRARTFLPRWRGTGGDPLAAILEAQAGTARAIVLVPIVLAWERAPERARRTLKDRIFGAPDAPGRTRKIWNFAFSHRKAVVKVGEVVVLPEFLAENGHLDCAEAVGQKLRWELHQRLRVENRVMRGPVLKTRRMMMEELNRPGPFQDRIRAIGAEEGRSPAEATRMVRGYLREMLSDWRLGYIELFDRILRQVFSRLYAGIETDGVDRVLEAAKRASLVVLPSHRSHIDYLLISYVFFGNALMPPHIAAGANLDFWPVGHFFRRAGAFFIRRTVRQDRLYAETLRTYVQKLHKEGYPVEFFIEGGRSRTGKMLRPRYGLLGHVVEAVVDGHVHDLSICPAAISYERIIEGATYARELSGADKNRESFGGVLRASRALRSRWGRVYLKFAEPLSLRAFLEEEGVDLGAGFRDADERRLVLRRLGYRVTADINGASFVTPSAVVATVLLLDRRPRIDHLDLLVRVGGLLDYLLHRGAPLASSLAGALAKRLPELEAERAARVAPAIAGLDGSGALSERIGAAVAPVVVETTAMFARGKLLQRVTVGVQTTYAVPADRRLGLDYYRNSIVHHLVRPALLAACLLRCAAAGALVRDRIRQEAQLLSGLFKLEHVYAQRRGFHAEYHDAFVEMESAGIVTTGPGGRVTIDERWTGTLELLREVVAPLIEGYHRVAVGASQLDGAVDEPAFLRSLRPQGERPRSEGGGVTRAEAASTAVFQNAIARFAADGLIERTHRPHRRKTVAVIAPGPEAGKLAETVAWLGSHLAAQG